MSEVVLTEERAMFKVGTQVAAIGRLEVRQTAKEGKPLGDTPVMEITNEVLAEIYFYDVAVMTPFLGKGVIRHGIATHGESCRWHKLDLTAPSTVYSGGRTGPTLVFERARLLKTASRTLLYDESAREVVDAHWLCVEARAPDIDRSWLSWHDATVPHMVARIMSEKRWEDLPILADALEEAGCTNAEILSHLREPWFHTEGCWVLDELVRAGKT